MAKAPTKCVECGDDRIVLHTAVYGQRASKPAVTRDLCPPCLLKTLQEALSEPEIPTMPLEELPPEVQAGLEAAAKDAGIDLSNIQVVDVRRLMEQGAHPSSARPECYICGSEYWWSVTCGCGSSDCTVTDIHVCPKCLQHGIETYEVPGTNVALGKINTLKARQGAVLAKMETEDLPTRRN